MQKQRIPIDYKAAATAFEKLRGTGEKVSIKAFCRKMEATSGKRISARHLGRVLAQLRKKASQGKNKAKGKPGTPTPFTELQLSGEWPNIKERFFEWEFRSISALARHLGVRADHRGLRAATAGWSAERGKHKKVLMSQTVEELARSGAIHKGLGIYCFTVYNVSEP